MGSLLLDLVAFAIGLLITPAAIAAGILFLASRQPVPNASAFAVAFILVYGLLSAAALTATGTSTGPLISTTTKSVVGIAVGVVLLGAALRLLVRRDASIGRGPAWMAEIEDAAPGRAFVIGLVLSIANPNVAILLGGLATIAATDLSTLDQVLGALLLVGAASIALVVPIVAYVLATEAVTSVLATIRRWLVRHQPTLNVAVLVVFGVVFVARGLAGVS